MARSRRAPADIVPVFWHFPGLPFEGRRAVDSTACYRQHTHATLSIGIVDEGRSRLTLPHEQLPLRAGDVVVVYPREVHACNPDLNRRWSYRMFYFDWEWSQRIFQSVGATAHPLPRRFRDIRALRVANQIERAMTGNRPASERTESIKTCLIALVDLARRSSMIDPAVSTPTVSTAIERARIHIEQHVEDRLPLSKLAESAGLTPYQFLRKFKKEVGLTPHAYQLDQRVIRARQFLQAKRSASTVAYTLGFADQSHFQRVFRRRVAATPGQYQARAAHREP